MWLKDSVVTDVGRVARIRYVDRQVCAAWNAVRREGELRLLTGWCWTAKRGGQSRQGFKTKTVAIRDAWYVLVRKEEVPALVRRPRLVARRAA